MVHEAATDRMTVVNLTNRCYFRFVKQIPPLYSKSDSLHNVETHKINVPMGKLLTVQKTNYDFLTEKPIGEVRPDSRMIIDL